MEKDSFKGITEWIRNKLNSLPENDAQDNNYRIGWQALTYVVATLAEDSSDPKLQQLGKSAKRGAKLSFIDLVALKLTDWLDSISDPYLSTKYCDSCGCKTDSWNSYCPSCFREI